MLQGIFPVVAMPFTEIGEVHYTDFEKLVYHLENTDAQGSILFGIASEFYKLTDDEKKKLVDIYLNTGNSTSKKIISVTDHSTEVAGKKAVEYEQQGVDALMLLPPFFLNPNKEQLIDHVTSVLKKVSIPVILQYAPTETNCLFTMDDMYQLGKKFNHLVYKIESPNPINEIEELLNIYPKANILNGYAGIHMLSVLDRGGVGIIPGCSFTELYTQIYNLYCNDKKEQAKNMHIELKKYIDIWMGHVEYIIKVEKAILQYRGIISSSFCRRPHYNQKIDLTIIQEFCEKFKL